MQEPELQALALEKQKFPENDSSLASQSTEKLFMIYLIVNIIQGCLKKTMYNLFPTTAGMERAL